MRLFYLIFSVACIFHSVFLTLKVGASDASKSRNVRSAKAQINQQIPRRQEYFSNKYNQNSQFRVEASDQVPRYDQVYSQYSSDGQNIPVLRQTSNQIPVKREKTESLLSIMMRRVMRSFSQFLGSQNTVQSSSERNIGPNTKINHQRGEK